MPDPSTLGGPEDDIPAAAVPRTARMEPASSQGVVPPPQSTARMPARPVADLMGGDSAPQRPSTTEPISRQAPGKAAPAAPRQTTPGDSLLGLDFLGGSTAAPPERPASASASGTAAPPRTDLKQSILSLYASAPKPAAPTQHQRGPSDGFGSMQSPGLTSPGQSSGSGLGDMNDAFSSLSFTSSPSPPQQQAQPSAFANLSSASRKQPSTTSASSFGGGGSFFDPPAAKATTTQPPAPQRTQTQGSGFGDFFSATSPVATAPPSQPSNAFGGDLFDLSSPSQPAAPAAAPAPPPKPASDFSSAFNLSQPSQPAPVPKPAAAAPVTSMAADPWGSSDVWASSNAPAAAPAPAAPKASTSNGFGNDFGGWNDAPAAPKPAPQITQDDDFGGWSSAPNPTQPAVQQQPPKPSGGFSSNSDDLFSNVWE